VRIALHDDRGNRVLRDAELEHFGDHRFSAGHTEQRRLDDQQEPLTAHDERSNRGRKRLRRIDDRTGTGLREVLNERFDFVGLERETGVNVLRQFDGRHPVAKRYEREVVRVVARFVEFLDAAKQQRDGAPAAEVTIHKCDAPAFSERLCDLERDRRRSDAALTPDYGDD